MCKPKAQGGQRCSAHADKRLRECEARAARMKQRLAKADPTNISDIAAAQNNLDAAQEKLVDAMIDYASTPRGLVNYNERVRAAQTSGNTETAAFYEKFIQLGKERRENATRIYNATRRASKAAPDCPEGWTKTVDTDGPFIVTRYEKDGVLHDLLDGTPALTHIDEKTETKTFRHYRNGLLNDGDNGEPAVIVQGRGHIRSRMYFQNGTPKAPRPGVPVRQDFYVGGQLQADYHTNPYHDGTAANRDSIDGSPMCRKYAENGDVQSDTYADNRTVVYAPGEAAVHVDPRDQARVTVRAEEGLRIMERRQNGVLEDGPKGEAAVRTYTLAGQLQSEYFYTDGVPTPNKLGITQIDYAADGKVLRVVRPPRTAKTSNIKMESAHV